MVGHQVLFHIQVVIQINRLGLFNDAAGFILKLIDQLHL